MRIVSSGILVLGILLMRKMTWRVISRKMQYAIWLFAGFFFLAGPFISFSSPISFANLVSYLYDNSRISHKFDSYIVGDEEINFDEANVNFNIYSLNGLSESLDDKGKQVKKEKNVTEEETGTYSEMIQPEGHSAIWLFKVWLILKWSMTVIFLIYVIGVNVKFYVYCKRNRRLYKTENTVKLRVYLLKGIASPFLFGKSIYIDTDMTENAQALEHILLHEMCHFKNGDMLWTALRYLSICLNWYNPFVWIAAHYVKRDCELACDEAVIRIIGKDASSDYGRTLIYLLRNQKEHRRKITVSTAMSDKKSALKERIIKMKDMRKSNRVVTICMITFMSILTGCAFFEKTEKEVINNDSYIEQNDDKDIIDNENVTVRDLEEIIEKDIDEGNNYYNSVKYYDGYFYYADGKKLNRRKEDSIITETGETEILAKGNIKLGNISNGNIYYIKYYSDSVKDSECGVYQLDCNTLAETKLLNWDDSLWMCSDVYVTDEKLFLEMADSCMEYHLSGDEIQEIKENDNSIINALLACNISVSSINELEAGYVSTYFEYGYFILYDEQENQITIYDASSRQIINTISECGRDIIVMEKGIVYRGVDGCIYVCGWKNNDSQLLYSPIENENQNLNYGTYDSEYLYAFIENNPDVELVRISWEGECQPLMTIGNVKRTVALGLSVNKGYLSFRQNGTLNFIKQ